MNRRGFLTGLLAAVAAPAVITTPGLLMPVSTWALPTYGPGNGMLTPDMIAVKQTNVQWQFSSQELTLCLEEFSDRYLAPAVAELAKTIKGGRLALGASLQNPNDVDFAAVHSAKGVSTRVVRAYDVFTDTMPMRVDVLHS